jgi:prepilin-type N-terminal cleavage/methylation domain-containing protein
MRLFVRHAQPDQSGVSLAFHDVPPASPRRLRARRGVSMVEMVVVLVISGIVLNIALPKFAAMRDQMNLRSAKQEFQAYLMTARAAAVRQSRPAQFHVVNNSAWTMVTSPSGAATTVNQRLRLFRTRNVIITMNGSAPNDSIVYDARGIASWPLQRRTYVLTLNNFKDSVCVSRAGLIARQCTW